mgnify:FL=1
MEDKRLSYKAIARNIPYSAYKLRPIVDVIRDKSLEYALHWLSIYRTRRSMPVQKVLNSAFANARYNDDKATLSTFVIKEIKVDQGMSRKYMKPSAQGRGQMQKRRHCHIFVSIGNR